MVTLCSNSLGLTRRWCGMDGDTKIFINSDGRVMKPHRAIRAFIHILEHKRIGTFAYLLHSTLERDLSIVENDNMIGNLKGLFKFMRHKNTGQSHGIIELTNQARCDTKRNRIETGKRLVVQIGRASCRERV